MAMVPVDGRPATVPSAGVPLVPAGTVMVSELSVADVAELKP
jgi:hypothetical protein